MSMIAEKNILYCEEYMPSIEIKESEKKVIKIYDFGAAFEPLRYFMEHRVYTSKSNWRQYDRKWITKDEYKEIILS